MGLTLEDILDLRSGWREPIIVGELPYFIHLALNLRVPQVHLSTDSLAHIAKKHPDITDFDLLLLTPTIGRGMIMRERKKPNVLLAVYQDPETPRRFAAVMKIVSSGCEVWLTSFHRAHARQTKQWLKRCDLFMAHDKR
jgi:hypothetical protein